MKKVDLLEIEDSYNIGLSVYANNNFCLVSPTLNKKVKKKIQEVLRVPIYEVTVLGTELINVFLNGNDNILISPELPEKESLRLKEICQKHNVIFKEIKNKLNTFGNNILIAEKVILISKGYDNDFKNFLKDLFKKEITELEIDSIGTLSKFLNGNLILSSFIGDSIIDKISKNIDVKGLVTISKGRPYIKYGIVGNDNGLLISSDSSTIEIQNIVELLDYVE